MNPDIEVPYEINLVEFDTQEDFDNFKMVCVPECGMILYHHPLALIYSNTITNILEK